MTDADVIAAIRQRHLKANIQHVPASRQRWDQAWVDKGGTIFGPGPYVQLPVEWPRRRGNSRQLERVVIRVYAPERVRVRLAKAWRPRS